MAKDDSESIKISAGQRTYFLNVKEAKNGAKYLVLTESKRNSEGKFDNQRVMIFADHFPQIFDALKKVAPELGVTA